MQAHWLDKLTAPIAPRWTLQRQRARAAAELLHRHYEAASVGRRTQHWYRLNTDANAAQGPSLAYLRASARDLVRNNPFASSALQTIVDHAVGIGIVAKPEPANAPLMALWRAWGETTACDADGRNDLYGLQRVVMRSIARDGEVLVRRRFRRVEDGLPIPVQLQVLEADFLDTLKDGTTTGGGRIIQGVEYDVLGKRAAYWLFREHPGQSNLAGSGTSFRIPASEVLHLYKAERPGQVRAASWFAPALLRFKDFDEFEDATLMKQKIAACLSVLVTDVDGQVTPLGTTTTEDPMVDTLGPGMIANIPPGRNVEVVQPPTATDYPVYASTVLRAIAAGLGVTYEDLTGDYTNLPFSAARMSRIRHWARVDEWRWSILVPQFCDPVWRWAMSAALMGIETSIPAARWTAPPMPMIEPDKEGLAIMRNVRAGIITMPEAMRERGYDPDEMLAEMKAWNEKLDANGIVLDSDARQMTQSGQKQGTSTATVASAAPSTEAAA